MTRITKDRGALIHDDRLDALAIAVAYWVEHMARDNNKAVDQLNQAALDKDLKDFLRNAIGIGSKKPRSWQSNNEAISSLSNPQ